MVRAHKLFLEQGGTALGEIRKINTRLDKIKAEVAADFPLDEAQVLAMRENLRTHVLGIHDIEREAITALQEAMA